MIEVQSPESVGLPIYHETFSQLDEWAQSLKPQRVDRSAKWIGSIFEAHAFIDTPENREFAEMLVSSAMAKRIADEIGTGTGEIVWRYPLEWEIIPIELVGDWREDGPVYHIPSGRRGAVLPGKFAIAKAHCGVARLDAGQTEHEATP